VNFFPTKIENHRVYLKLYKNISQKEKHIIDYYSINLYQNILAFNSLFKLWGKQETLGVGLDGFPKF